MRGAIHGAEPCMGKGRGQGIGLGAWQTWQRRRSSLMRRGIYLGGRSTTIKRHENEEAKGIKDNGYSKEEKITIHRKEEKKTKKEKGVGRPAGQEWIEVRTGSRCCQDRIGCQTLGPKAPGGFSPMGVDFFGSSTRA